MQLSPIDPEASHFPIADEDAVLRQAPKGKELERKLGKRLKKLEKLHLKFQASRRYAMLIVLQGRDSAGKDGTIRRVFETCPQQSLQVTNFRVPVGEETEHDYLWRVHRAIPRYGDVGIFNRSHYEDIVTARVHDLVPKDVWSKRYDQINDFERMLTENRIVVLKFFLHVSRDEQKRRQLARLQKKKHQWKFQIGDLDDRALWESFTSAYHDVFRRCSTPYAPWFIVPADDKKVRDYLVAGAVIRTHRLLNLKYPTVDSGVISHAEKVLRG